MTEAPRVLLVDGHSLAFRAFYGYPAPSFMTSTGQYTNAVYGFATMLLGVIRSEEPTHIGVAFDRSRITFRNREYSEYKATRGETPQEFEGQIGLIKDFLDALGISHLDLDDFEADDIIATWTRQACDQDMEVLISSGDRDSYQLIREGVTVLYPSRDGMKRMTPEAVEADYGVSPERYPELAALVGEVSDNLPGVPGVGPKTAAKWLSQFDGLENLICRASQVPGKSGESLREHIADVKRNRRLNALVEDIDLPISCEDLGIEGPDMAAVNTLFDTLQFRALREKVRDTFAVRVVVPVEEMTAEVTTVSPGQATAWLEKHGHGEAGLEIQGQWKLGSWDLEAIAIAAADGAVGWFDLSGLTPEDDHSVAAWMADPKVPKNVHDLKESLIGIWDHGWDLAGVVCDTQLAAYLANPDRRSLDLGSLAERYLNRTLSVKAVAGEVQPSFDFEEDSSALAAGVNARTIADLSPVIRKELANKDSKDLLSQMELPLTRVLAHMERTGIAMDLDFLKTLHGLFNGQVHEAERHAFDAIGYEINLSSPKQLQAVLFDDLEMPKTRRTKSGYTTDAEALDQLFEKTAHPFLEHLLVHRDVNKLRQTVEGLIKAVADDGRIHTTYLQTGAATGRLSSQDPNLQNIPIRTPAGNQIRQAFVAGPEFESLMTADYSQIEMRIMAHVSGDQLLIDAFNSGQDFHTVMAAHVFDIDAAQVSTAQRSKVKAVNYGLAYGLSAFGLSNQLKISVGEATRLMDGYFEEFGRVRDYLKSLVSEARQSGYTETLLGRRRYLPDLDSSNRTRREMAERMALNAPIQGTAADIIKIAMLRVGASLVEQGFQSRMLLQVHDELVFEVAHGEAVALEEMVRREMAGAIELKIPLDISVGIGSTWASAAH
ncbi:MAG: DNA polymerase I [Propionibacteriaceae bacterium]|nr:DNA polymerase I [Propionibacteriaceae bacterium]